jgi:hypothetical protein
MIINHALMLQENNRDLELKEHQSIEIDWDDMEMDMDDFDGE